MCGPALRANALDQPRQHLPRQPLERILRERRRRRRLRIHHHHPRPRPRASGTSPAAGYTTADVAHHQHRLAPLRRLLRRLPHPRRQHLANHTTPAAPPPHTRTTGGNSPSERPQIPPLPPARRAPANPKCRRALSAACDSPRGRAARHILRDSGETAPPAPPTAPAPGAPHSAPPPRSARAACCTTPTPASDSRANASGSPGPRRDIAATTRRAPKRRNAALRADPRPRQHRNRPRPPRSKSPRPFHIARSSDA